MKSWYQYGKFDDFNIYYKQIYTDVVVLIYLTVVTQTMKWTFIMYFLSLSLRLAKVLFHDYNNSWSR